MQFEWCDSFSFLYIGRGGVCTVQQYTFDNSVGVLCGMNHPVICR